MNTTRRLILEARLDQSVIRGTLTAPSGERRPFHGWLEFNTAVEAALDPARPEPGDGRKRPEPGDGRKSPAPQP